MRKVDWLVFFLKVILEIKLGFDCNVEWPLYWFREETMGSWSKPKAGAEKEEDFWRGIVKAY